MVRRDLDGWAVALGVTDDDGAVNALGHLTRTAHGLEEAAADICDELRGVDARGLAARAAARLSVAVDRLIDTRVAFLRHERGL